MGKAVFATGALVLLAAIALGVWWPSIREAQAEREAQTRAEEAALAYMRSELRNFNSAQEVFRQNNGHYAQQISDLRYAGLFNEPARGVSLRLVETSRAGYVVEASAPSLDFRCTTWRGTIDSPPEGQVAAEVACN